MSTDAAGNAEVYKHWGGVLSRHVSLASPACRLSLAWSRKLRNPNAASAETFANNQTFLIRRISRVKKNHMLVISGQTSRPGRVPYQIRTALSRAKELKHLPGIVIQ